MSLLTNEQADVLDHASKNGRYVTGDARVLEMAREGLLRDYGPQALAGGDHYLTVTPKGREALNRWRAVQPKPPRVKRRRRSPAFAAWRVWCELSHRIPFSQFLKEIWPEWKHYTYRPWE